MRHGMVACGLLLVAACAGPAAAPGGGVDRGTPEMIVTTARPTPSPSEEPSMPAPSTVAYGDHPDQVADLYLPAGDGPFPVVVLIHGGFWREQYCRGLMARLAADLVGRGIAAWNIEYRRVGGDGGYPQTLADAAAALDHLARLDERRLDLDRVATVGHSAGGHLALWLAGRDRLPEDAPGAGPALEPCAAVGQAAVSDLAAAAELGLGSGAVQDLLGGGPGQVPMRYAAGDPAALLPLGVPQLLVHGEDDRIVPSDLSRRYARAARDAGDTADVSITAGDHFVHLDPASDAWLTTIDWLGDGCGR